MKRRSFLQSLIALAAGPVALPVQSKVPVVESVVRHGVGDYTINFKWDSNVKYTGNGSYNPSVHR